MKWTTPALISTLAAAVVGSTLAIAVAPRRELYGFFDPIVDIRAMLEQHYADTLDNEALQRGAIEGMLDTLNDPYTVFVPADDTADFAKDLTGAYVGIGAEVGLRDGWFTILTPLDDSPAWRAGLLAEDRIVAIDGDSTEGLGVDACIERLMGKPGTVVTLTVERTADQGAERLDIAIARAPIRVNPVKGFARADAGEGAWRYTLDTGRDIAYIRLSQFTPNCAAEVLAAIESATADAGGNLGGLILDLRFNPGGVLSQAVRIADAFLREGVIVSTEGRTTPTSVERASAEGTLPDFPVVLLVNAQSASASEVLAGALADNGRAIVMGTRTFGKGLVQSVRPLPSGAGVLKITEQHYALPGGRDIQRRDDSTTWGVDPTEGYYFPMSDDETRAMLAARRKQEIIAHRDDASPERTPERLDDPQLTAALRVMQHRVDTGVFAPVGIPEHDAGAIAADALSAVRQQRDRLLRELVRIDRRLAAAAEGAPGAADERDLWADDRAIVGGTVTVTDAMGNPLSTLRITGPNLERWLVDAGVEPIGPAEPETQPGEGP